MKKLVCVLMALVMILPAFALAQEVVNVYNWEDYIDESVLEQFEEETGIHVNYIRFTTNEEMLVQMDADSSAYDVVFPSDYCVQRFVQKGLLEELDFSKIPNFVNIRSDLLDPSFDPGNRHSVPYMAGTLGILYNKAIVDEEDVQSWRVLWNPKYKGEVMMMDSIRDAMAIGLILEGYSVNDASYEAASKAAALLITQKQQGMIKAYGLDEFKDKMVAGEAALAVVYSGDAEYALEEADDSIELGYVIPVEGSNVWTDCAVIPAAARNKENAYKFIDFLCRPDIAIRNIEAIGYVCVNQTAIDMMLEMEPEEGEVRYADKYILNPTEEELARCEFYNDLDSVGLTIFNTMWQEVKNAK